MPDASTLIAGRYRLGEMLGEGGMGRVWRARDEALERDVAIKEILLPEDLPATDRDTARRRTMREARAAARLGHHNVVEVFDVIERDGRACIVMEYVPSRSLQEVVREDGPLEPRDVARIGLDLLDALRAAHAVGVEHRDVKPANVLLADDGRVMLTDFGIATIEGDGQSSVSDLLIGSPEYMSPERARHGSTGLGSDLWSLGATLYTAVEGRSPFHRASTVATLTALAADEPDPPRQAGPLQPVLEGLLRKDPAERLGADETEQLLLAVASEAYGRAAVTPTGRKNRAATSGGKKARGAAAPAGKKNRATVAPAVEEGPAAVAPVEEAGPGDPSATPASAGSSASPVSAGSSVSPASPASAASSASAESSAAPAPAPSASSSASPGSSAAPAPSGSEGSSASASAGSSAAPAPSAADDPASRSASSRRRPLIAAGAAVLVLIVALAVWLVARDAGDDTPTTAPLPAGAPSAPAATDTSAAPTSDGTGSAPASAGSPATSAPTSAPAPSATTGATDALPPLPAGWKRYRDKTGFSLYVRTDWNRTQEGRMVYFRSRGRVLGIDQSDKPKSNPVADWRGQRDARRADGDFPGYREVRLTSVDYFRKAADWEFTFNLRGNRQHVNNRGLVVSAKQAYGIYWQTPDADWSAARDDLDLVFDSFRPAAD